VTDFDTVSKKRVQASPKDFVQLSLGPNTIKVLCVQTADSLDVPNKGEYLTELAILSGLVYEPQTIRNIISEETIYESSIVQYFTERATQQGHQAGVRERAIEDILEVLALRFQSDVAQTLKLPLEALDDLQHLKQLHRAAILADTLEDFQQVLAEN
jgi:hypothetical protein